MVQRIAASFSFIIILQSVVPVMILDYARLSNVGSIESGGSIDFSLCGFLAG
jgi:hypothetical protein